MKKFIAIGLALLCLVTVCVCVTWKERTPALVLQNQDGKDVKVEEPLETAAPTETPAPTPEPEPEDHISPIMAKRFEDVSGNHNWAVHTFSDGRTYKKNGDKSVPSASVIKLFMMEYIYNRIYTVGDLEMTDTIGGRTIKSLVFDMIAKSDNEATNLVIGKFGMDTFNQFFAEKGYTGTKLERKMLDYDAMAAGKENYTSVDDVLLFLKKIYENKDSDMYADMISIMKQQVRRWKIPKKLPEGIAVANKTGELDTVENDVGIVFSEHGDYIVIFLSSKISSKDGTIEAIANTSGDLYNYFAS